MRTWLHIFAISLLGLVIYSNTFDAPFHFDDFEYIADNPLLRDPSYLLGSSAQEHALSENIKISLSTRYVAYLSFLLDYQAHGLDVAGYHAVNLAVHVLNACLVYFLVITIFRTPFVGKSPLAGHAPSIALLSSLLFVAHPVQTEAVTYISQRFTSLAAFFYLLSVLFYARHAAGRRGINYAVSLIAAVLAMKTKEIAFTLPLSLVLYELMFLDGPAKRRAARLAPLLLTMLIIPLSLINIDKPISEAIAEASKMQPFLPRWKYLFVEFKVIVTYLRLLALPINQNLDYDYFSPTPSFFIGMLLSIMFLAALLYAAVSAFRRYRHSAPWSRVAAFGTFWFFLTLSVESSFIPLGDLIFEHRLYLPSVGAIAAFSVTAASVMYGPGRGALLKGAALSAATLMLVLFSFLTYSRNGVWNDEISLWSDVVAKSPWKWRGYNNLGSAYLAEDRPVESIETLRTALRLNPEDANVRYNLARAYIEVGRTEEAKRELEEALGMRPEATGARDLLERLSGTQPP